jgi:hypothetical protein
MCYRISEIELRMSAMNELFPPPAPDLFGEGSINVFAGAVQRAELRRSHTLIAPLEELYANV